MRRNSVAGQPGARRSGNDRTYRWLTNNEAWRYRCRTRVRRISVVRLHQRIRLGLWRLPIVRLYQINELIAHDHRTTCSTQNLLFGPI